MPKAEEVKMLYRSGSLLRYSVPIRPRTAGYKLFYCIKRESIVEVNNGDVADVIDPACKDYNDRTCVLLLSTKSLKIFRCEHEDRRLRCFFPMTEQKLT